MGPKANIFMGVLVIAVSVVVLILCSSTAIQEYILELVRGR